MARGRVSPRGARCSSLLSRPATLRRDSICAKQTSRNSCKKIGIIGISVSTFWPPMSESAWDRTLTHRALWVPACIGVVSLHYLFEPFLTRLGGTVVGPQRSGAINPWARGIRHPTCQLAVAHGRIERGHAYLHSCQSRPSSGPAPLTCMRVSPLTRRQGRAARLKRFKVTMVGS